MRTPVCLAALVILFGCPGSSNSPQPSVIALQDVAAAHAPHGKAQIQVLAEGQHAFFGRLELEPHAAVPLHRDASEETIFVLEGSGVLTIDGQEYPVQAGTTAFMPALAQVHYQNGPTRLVALQIFAGANSQRKYDNWSAKSPKP